MIEKSSSSSAIDEVRDDASTIERRVEHCASKVVQQIQRVIDRIRVVNTFQPSLKQKINDNNGSEAALENEKLYGNHFKKDSEAIGTIIAECDDVFGGKNEDDLLWNYSKASNEASGMEEDRILMVGEVAWPLLHCLSKCYSVLDSLPQTPSSSPRTNTQTKPPPPRGMLSIQQYTDIAVFIEFLVCTSIMPHLQSNILVSAEERVQHRLPSSLAGRIPRSSLLWGTATVQQNSFLKTDRTAAARAIRELRQTITIICQVLLLDRFRPMLLPRHLSDVHAAIFQTEALEKQTIGKNEKQGQCLFPTFYDDVVNAVLPTPSRPSRSYKLVDSILLARSFQTLLLRGRSTPAWLRQRVSHLLVDMARRDLAPIVHVFVQSAPRQDRSGASLRLALALTAGKTSDDLFLSDLCIQLTELLDIERMDASDDLCQQANLLTVWAVLNQLPPESLLLHLSPRFSEILIPIDGPADPTTIIHKTIRRIVALLSSAPPSANCAKVCRLFLCPAAIRKSSSGTQVTLLGQLLRLASMPSVLESSIKEDALVALRLFVSVMVQSTFPWTAGVVEGSDVLAMALLYATAPTFLDAEGYRYDVTPSRENTDSQDRLIAVSLTCSEEGNISDTMMETMEARVATIVRDLLSSIAKDFPMKDEEGLPNAQGASLLPSRIFHLLLLCYFSTLRSQGSAMLDLQVPSVYQQEPDDFRMAVMLLLPRICEDCNFESLLLASDGGIGVLSMIKLILDCAASNSREVEGIANAEDDEKLQADTTKATVTGQSPFRLADALLLKYLGLQSEHRNRPELDSDESLSLRVETLLSTAALVVSLVIAMLELGSEIRLEEEEAVLQSMLPSLASLSDYKMRIALSQRDPSEVKAVAELAEIASYAMSLIAARAVTERTAMQSIQKQRPKRNTPADIICEAEKDLQSSQPPIRARGVLSLRRLAQQYVDYGTDQQVHQSLIVEIGEKGESGASPQRLEQVACEIVRVSVMALTDIESYVYLAAIQSIVAAADIIPRTVVPLLGQAVCTGVISLETEGDSRLSDPQRIKLAEALLFVIRRRGKAVHEVASMLMNLMLYGRRNMESTGSLSATDMRIQERTHRYFVENTAGENDISDLDTVREEKDLRLNTGGPVFETEERDVVRAACIMVVSELASAADVHLITLHTPILVHLIKHTLSLEESRPVRRAAASLCRELYNAALREYEEALESSQPMTGSEGARSLAVELVDADEESLVPLLERGISGKEVQETARLHDPATAARCQEALSARQEVQNHGMLVAAKLHLLSIQRDDMDPAVRAVKSRLREAGEGGEGIRKSK
jgi:hypothetical protein